jgi:L-seryl-tRNA(Ser) seleniumtransferase
VDNLRRFLTEGATLVAFSGGKAIRGPQNTGILCGRRDLIAAAILQQLDMDVSPETWTPPESFIPRQALRGIPHHGIGRGFKVSKEGIVGLIVALERFVRLDFKRELAAQEAQLEVIKRGLTGLAYVDARLRPAQETGSTPLLEFSFDEMALGRTAFTLSRALQDGEPPVHLGERNASRGVLTVDASGLRPGDETALVSSLRALLD